MVRRCNFDDVEVGRSSVSRSSTDNHGAVCTEVSKDGVWISSSSKTGHEICNVLNNEPECQNVFWQSDGSLPHKITVLFRSVVYLEELEIFLDHMKDESYTPLEILVKVGFADRNNLFDLNLVEIENPKGWTSVLLLDTDGTQTPAHILQLVILSNHQEGRDTRIRGIKVWAQKR